jgi:hypothetical protein
MHNCALIIHPLHLELETAYRYCIMRWESTRNALKTVKGGHRAALTYYDDASLYEAYCFTRLGFSPVP